MPFNPAHARRRRADARRHRREEDRRPVRRDSEGTAHRVAGRHSGRAQRNADRPPDVGARRAGRHAAQFHRRRRLRTSHPVGGVGRDHARRVLQRLHALPGRGLAGHAAAHLRIPDDDFLADRHGSLERLAVRRRLGGGGSLAHGDPRASQVASRSASWCRPRCIRTTARWRWPRPAARACASKKCPVRKASSRSRISRSTRAKTSPPS